MQTPTDPYNSANRRPFDDDDEVLAPIDAADDETAPANSATSDYAGDEPLSYANAEALAWEQVFTAESAAAAAEQDSETEQPDTELAALKESENPTAATSSEAPAALKADTNFAAADSQPIAHSAETLAQAQSAQTNPANPAEGEESAAESLQSDGFNVLPAAQRANANLSDVLSAHSPDEAPLDSEAQASQSRNETPSVSIATPLGLHTGAATAENAENVATSDPNALPATGFMQPDASTDEEAERRARWEQGPSAYIAENEVDLEAPRSRSWTHVGIFFLTLLLIPVTWYLLSDASIRLSVVENNPWDTGVVSFAAITELFGGLVALLVLILIARASSLGAQIFGFVLTVGGLVALIIPNTVQSWLSELDSQIGGINAFTGNVVHHLGFDFGSGRIAIFGIVLLASGLAAHFARRAGAERATVYERRKMLGIAE